MILQTATLEIRRSTLNWLIPVISILCTNSILAIGANPEIQREQLFLTDDGEIMMAVDTMDYSVLTQRELKQELKKLKKIDPTLYNKVKSEFLKPNVAVRVALVLMTTFLATVLGVIAGCAIYSLEQ